MICTLIKKKELIVYLRIKLEKDIRFTPTHFLVDILTKI